MKRDAADLRASLHRLAATQAGFFTAGQAVKVGYSYPAQLYHHRRGEWSRVDRGIYRLVPWPDAENADLVRWTLWSRGQGVVSHDTALAVHSLGDVLPARVHLIVPAAFRASDPSVVLHRAHIDGEDVEERVGFRLSAPTRSILDTAADMDIDRLAHVIRDAVDRGLTSPGRLRRRADESGPSSALAIERALRQVGL
jgi:Predicted transcriptional regulator